MFPVILRREIIILLVIKAALLTALYVLFFSPAHRVEPTTQILQSHILHDRTP
jgi:hypothetical protein